jgi:hypothetical protein
VCRSVPPCYHSHLFINLCYTVKKPLRPSVHHSHLFIICVTRRVPLRPSVLSFASVHKFALHEGHVPPCYHSHLFINLRYEGAVPSLRALSSVHKICVTRSGHVPLCYHSSVHKLVRSARPSVLYSHLFIVGYTKGNLRAIIRIVHHVALHEGCRPPCYHSHLFITLRYTKGHVPPCYHSHLFINLRYTKARPLGIIRICSSNLCYTKGARPPCYHSHLASSSQFYKMSLTLNIPWR